MHEAYQSTPLLPRTNNPSNQNRSQATIIKHHPIQAISTNPLQRCRRPDNQNCVWSDTRRQPCFSPALGRLLRFLVSYFHNVYFIFAFIFTCILFWYVPYMWRKIRQSWTPIGFPCLFVLFIHFIPTLISYCPHPHVFLLPFSRARLGLRNGLDISRYLFYFTFTSLLFSSSLSKTFWLGHPDILPCS